MTIGETMFKFYTLPTTNDKLEISSWTAWTKIETEIKTQNTRHTK